MGVKRLAFAAALVALALAAAGGPPDPAVRGVVLDPAGRPLAGARVTLRSPHACCRLVPGFSFQTVTTDEDGRFAFDQPPTGMDVEVTHPALAPAMGIARDGEVVRLARAAWIEGWAPAGADVHVARGLRRIAAAQGGGAFRLGPLTPGERVTLQVFSPRHRPWQRVLSPDEGTTPVAVDLDEGLALDGRLLPPRGGVAVRASQGEPRESATRTAEDGTFRLTGLREGPVTLVVLEEGRDPVIVQGAAGGTVEVEVER